MDHYIAQLHYVNKGLTFLRYVDVFTTREAMCKYKERLRRLREAIACVKEQ